jgi:phosphate acetyltransferase
MTADTSPMITNVTFAELQLGQRASLSRVLAHRDVELFAVMSGDVNPMHVDEEYAHSDMFHRVIAHGMWGGALISTVLGTELPGPGTIYLEQELTFHHPVYIGDSVLVTVEVTAKRDDGSHRVELDCRMTNQNHDLVISGTALVIAPTERVCRPRAELPDVQLVDRSHRLRQLLDLMPRRRRDPGSAAGPVA